MDEQVVRRAARAASDRPSFLAWTLVQFQEAEHLDDEGLARWLSIDPAVLVWLALCRRPRPSNFAGDIAAISERIGIDPARLAMLIRQVDALAVLAEATGQNAGVLAAARDREGDQRTGPLEDET